MGICRPAVTYPAPNHEESRSRDRQAHSVRGFLTAVARRKLGFTLIPAGLKLKKDIGARHAKFCTVVQRLPRSRERHRRDQSNVEALLR